MFNLQTELSNNITTGWLVPDNITNCSNCQEISDNIDEIKKMLNNFDINTYIVINCNNNEINRLQPFIYSYDYKIRYIVTVKLNYYDKYNILSSNNIKVKSENNKFNLELELELLKNNSSSAHNNNNGEEYYNKYLKYKKKYLKYKI
jgi:molybdenum cofactor biosynthesis enzyme MoaA